MTIIEQAKTLLRSASLPSDLVTHLLGEPPEVQAARMLADSLRYQVAIDARWAPDDGSRPERYPGMPEYSGRRDDVRITDEDAVPLGTSKYRGLPHLPPDMPWPEGLYFGAQLNLTELAKVDRSDRLPKEGMLYFFYNGGMEARVIHWRGPVEELERRAYPELSMLPGADHYYERFRSGERIHFSPHWLLIDSESEIYDHSGLAALLPAELAEAVSGLLGAPLTQSDCIRRIYGRPFYFQEEDEMPTGYDDDGDPVWDDPPPRLVLLHDELGDAAVHFMCLPDAAARGDFSGVEVTASCT